MSTEGFPVQQDESPIVAAEAVYDEGYLRANFGISLEEANQHVEWGRHSGSLLAMLSSERCDARAIVAQAFQDEGGAGVVRVFTGLGFADSRFKPVLSEETQQAPPPPRPNSKKN